MANGVITKTCLFKYTENFTTKKNENFQIKSSDIFHISAQNIDCGYSLEPPRRGGSNEYPQSMVLSRNMKNNVYPCKPQFYYIKKWGLRGSKLYRYVFVMWTRIKLVLKEQFYLDVQCLLSPVCPNSLGSYSLYFLEFLRWAGQEDSDLSVQSGCWPTSLLIVCGKSYVPTHAKANSVWA